MSYIHGLGEMLRYLTELVDSGSEKTYPNLPVNYRSRYTPVLRAIISGATTVSEITSVTFLTQGAVSQTVALMEQDGILERENLTDGRKSALRLTPQGCAALSDLKFHWQSIFLSVDRLEKETGVPLMQFLEKAIKALEMRPIEERIREAKIDMRMQEKGNDAGQN
ncbi:MarR family winged helix-turn-helix transcriptional regulator [Dickeya chrysanthemi]|uniref:MarR family winged helix-turn-helix transcriptional regulator n=1 Tax=Dickeya chrysanthemi TaxID=556 RepID=UPI000A4DF459|nr:MarR family transcriptional regulator [Dickeya chrysanthemi]